MGEPYKVTVRHGPRVERARFATLDEALAAVAERVEAVDGRLAPVNALGREYDPARQVAARIELAGPRGLRGGVDVRGDGSAEAFRGRLRKVVLEQRRRESAVDALRRELGGQRDR